MADSEKTETVDLSTHDDPAVVSLFSRIEEFNKPLFALAEKVKSGSPPSVIELDKEFNSSDDPQLVEMREEIARLEAAKAQMREEAHKRILEGYETIDEDELTKLKKEFGEQYRKVQTAIGTLKDYADLLGIKGVAEGLASYKVPSLRSVGRVSGGATGTSNTPRPRLSSVTVTRQSDGRHKTVGTLGEAARWADQEITEVFAAWLKAADVSKWQDVSEVVEFDFSNINYEIVPQNADAASQSDSEEDSE